MKPFASFVTAFVLTLCVLAVPLSFGVIEWNMGHTVGGEYVPAVVFSVSEGVPRLADAAGNGFSLSPTATKGLSAAVAAPWRGMWYLLRGQMEAVVALWSLTD